MFKEIFYDSKNLICNIWVNWMNSPLIANFLKLVASIWFIFSGIHKLVYAILILAFIDVIVGVAASLKKGEKFNSRKLRKGLIEKTTLYFIVILVFFTIEHTLQPYFGYSDYYLVMTASVFILSYDGGSILESLAIIYPNNALIKRLGKLLNLFEETAENRLKKGLGVEEKDGEVTE